MTAMDDCEAGLSLQRVWAWVALVTVGTLTGVGVNEIYHGHDIGSSLTLVTVIGAIVTPLGAHYLIRH